MSDQSNPISGDESILEGGYRTLADSLPICLLLKDLDGRLVFVNRKLLELQGKSANEIVGRTDYDLFD